MAKDGIGNLEKWQYYNSYSGKAIYAALGLWLVTIIISIKTKSFSKVNNQIAIGLPPILVLLGWGLLWLV